MVDIDTREKINIKMKDSGVDWIGKVPIEWSKYKLKYIANFLLGGTPENKEGINIEEKGYPWITAPNIKNNRFYIDEFTQYISEEIVKKNNIKIFPKNSILLVCIASIGKICMIQNEMYANQQITAIISKSNFNNRYILYSVYASLDKMIFDATSSNVVPILNTQYLSNMEYIIPLFTEQQKIADFLDSKCQKIDDTIEKINRQIEVLKKYKQSLITEVVTKGLDKNAPMKDSGVDWIGKIPKNWDLIYVKHNCWLKGRIGWDGLQSSEYCEDGPYLITGTDFNNGIIDWNACVHISKERFEEDVALHIKENDLLITKDGTIGKVAVAKNCPEEVSLNSGVLLIRNVGKYKINSRYMYYVLISNQFIKWYEISQAGNSTIKHLYQEQFYNFKYTLPKMDEQKQIVDFLDKKCAKIDAIIDKKSKQIEILERYKKSLIYEYVTGKKRV